MSFIYKAMMTRGPNKRKIKVNEENILRLMTTNSADEDEEDEDFTISKEKEQDNDGSESEESSTESSADDDNNDDDDSDKTDSAEEIEEKAASKRDDQPTASSSSFRIRQSTKRVKPTKTRKTIPRQTVKELRAQISSEYYGLPSSTVEILSQAKRQWKQSENVVKNLASWPDALCAVCLNEERTTVRNKLITCQKCGVSVHEDCYNTQHKSNNRGNVSDIWICNSCVYGGNDIVCQFCPNLWGCMKETKCGRWCHIVCARNILADFLYNTPNSLQRSPTARSTIYLQLNDCNNKMFGSKDCVLCEDRLVSKTGICIKCDAGLCKSSFHVTCAQRHGLLSKVVVSGDSNNNSGGDTYYANCPLHCNKEEMKNRQKEFILQLKTAEIQSEKLDARSFVQQNAVTAKIHELRQAKKRRSDTYIPPRPPLEQVPRLLSSDAHFTRLLNNKTEKMFGITTRCPATIIPKATEVRKRHFVAPSLTTDFSAYFVDRELRIEEEKSCLASAITANRELSEKQEWERLKYNEHRESLMALRSDRNDLKTDLENLKLLFSSISDWASSSHTSIPTTSGMKRRKSISPRKMTGLSVPLSPVSPKKRLSWESSNETIEEMSTSPLSPCNSREHIPDAESIIELKSCGICKGNQNQHLLARCDVCREWQHLACLDPPLTQMPKRTKYALWQCSECADTSGSSSSDCDTDNHGTFTGQDGRRLTRRFRRVPDKLAVGFPDDQTGVEKSKSMIGHTKLARKRQKRMQDALRNIKRKPQLKQSMGIEKERTETNLLAPYPIPTTSSRQPLEFGRKSSLPLSSLFQNQTDSQKSHGMQRSSQNIGDSLMENKSRNWASCSVGISRSIFLSQSNRIPIIRHPKPLEAYPASNKLKRIIIMKKNIVVPHRPRPVGLGKAKKIFLLMKKQNKVENPTAVVKKDVKKVRKCDVCKTCEGDARIVTCETCKKHYHWKCCDPPLKSNPVKKWMAWECSTCVDEKNDDHDNVVEEQQDMGDRGSSVPTAGRRMINRKRKPPQVFEPDFNVFQTTNSRFLIAGEQFPMKCQQSTQQKIFRSIEKQKLRKKVPAPIRGTPDGSKNKFVENQTNSQASAARCRPLEGQLRSSKTSPSPVSEPTTSTTLLPFPKIATLSMTTIKVLKSLSKSDAAKFKTISVIKKSPGSSQSILNLPIKTPSSIENNATTRDTKTTSEKMD